MAADDVPVRIGDVERRRVDDRLQQAVGDGQLTLGEYDERAAQVWQARTQAELAVVTRDLPAPPSVAPVPVTPTRAGRRPRRVLAVMSSDGLTGRLVPGQDVEAYAVMGEAVLDLRREDLPAEVRVRATAVMGSVQVLVPRGATVHLEGLSLMGQRELRLDPSRPDGPQVDLTGYALMGSVEVHHGGDTPGVSLRKPEVARRAGGHSVRVHAPRRHHRGRVGLLAGVAALGLAGLLGFSATGQDSSAVFGSSTYQVAPGQTSVHVGTMFGSVKVVVPDNTRVDAGGTVVFGSLNCQQACTGTGNGPVVAVHGTGAFGSVEVQTQSEAKADSSDN